MANKRALGKKRAVTFGSFNSYVKVRPEMLALWCDILLQVPGSRLLMQASGLGGAEITAQIRSYFKKRGVDIKRLEIRGWTGLTEYFQLGEVVDIALDPYPFNGGVTTCHALWMGMPVVTMSGESAASRVGRSILSRMGLSELVAENPTQYVAIAVNLAKNHDKLTELRASLREKMVAGGILNGGALAKQAESAYRTVWRNWCDQRTNASD
jgi:predicted O-linked N-acetylglucosamine transferase (SPINDLY family)